MEPTGHFKFDLEKIATALGILSFVSAIWGLIEGVLILTGSMNVDANGIPLTD